MGTYYTAFGLTMAGISSRALNGIAENKIKFQGQEFANKEFSDGSGLDWYEFKYRMHDPQTGRFLQIDPLADKYVYNSPYAFSENKVTSHVELEGLETFSVQDLWRSAGITSSTDPKEYTQNVAKEATKPSTWMSALQMMSPVVGGVLLGILTEGIGSGTVVEAETTALRSMPKASASASSEAATGEAEAGATNIVKKPRNAPASNGIPNSSTIDAKDATGKTTKYSTYDENGKLIKQVEADRGVPRHGTEGATKKIPTTNTDPNTGLIRPGKPEIKPAEPDEIPPGNNTRNN